MKTLDLVPAPSSPFATKSETQWWPNLYLRKGNRLAQITPDQCSKVAQICGSGRGNRNWKDIPLHDELGEKIGFISFNGRCWLNDIEGRVEIPQTGLKTAAQNEAEGWADYR